MDYKRILQLHYTNGFSGREIAAGTGDSKTAVNEFLKRFRECNELHYPLPDGVTNEYIEGLLYRKAGNQTSETLYREIDCEQLHRALRVRLLRPTTLPRYPQPDARTRPPGTSR